MADALKVFFITISALFPIVDPLSGSPIFLALTTGYDPQTRRSLSLQVAINSFILMCGSYFIGSHVLSFFGVSLPVVQVGGGLVVVAVGWKMLMTQDDVPAAARKAIQPQEVFRRAFYPLTLPLTVGPGSISVAITLGANTTRHYGVHILLILSSVIAMALIAASIYVCYGFSDRLGRMLGESGMSVIIRLSAFLLVCIGVQIMWNGLSSLITQLLQHTG